MIKLEKIKEAYGKYWESVKDYINVNGFVDSSRFPHGKIEPDFGDNNGELACDFYIRPLSLQGIENNNGWTKIDSKEDLPKDEENSYFVKTIYSKEILERDYPIFTKSMSIEEERKWWLENITHYQPIIKPQPPIY